MKTLIVVTLIVVVQLLLASRSDSALPPSQRPKQSDATPISLDDILTNRFSAGGFGGSWVPGSDNEIRIIAAGGTVIEHTLPELTNKTFVNATAFEYLGKGQYSGLLISPERDYILVEHARNNKWRHSFLAKYDIYNVATGDHEPLFPHDNGTTRELQLVRWAPTGNGLAFVFENDLYYRRGSDGVVQRITDDGSNATFNGIADWVYEEEMFGGPTAFWFSKDGNSIAFVKFDDSEVEFFQWPVYGEPGVRETVYPEYEPIRYPKSGQKNPKVSMHVVELKDNLTPTPIEIQYPTDQDATTREYIATATWTTNTTFALVTLNRAQNQSFWNLCSSKDGICSMIYRFEQENGWIDAHTPIISNDGTRLLTLQPVKQANDTLYTHIVEISTSGTGSKQMTAVTSGMMSVGSILGWDETKNKIFFSASFWDPQTSTANPSETHVYTIDHPSTARAGMNCITCGSKNNANEDCKSNSISFSSEFTYMTHSCGGPGVPQVVTKRLDDSSVVKVWVDNNDLRDALQSKKVPITRDYTVPVEGGFEARVRLYLPSDFDENKKYPLLIDVYAGPDSQRIADNYRVDWGTSLVSDKGIIYGSIDGRGSAKQSDNLKFTVYRKLGSYEIDDQIAVTKHLVDNYNFIDANKTAIWGWSYGGYATSMVLGKDSENVFKCGIAVAPVTSWLYYDTIYTERYMGTPWDNDNWSGYDEGSVMNHLENFKTKQFLLIHGNADDNVHYQQSMMLARAMEQSDVMFYQLSYPDENHSIGGPGMKRHLYHSIERFLSKECFGGFTPSTISSGANVAISMSSSLVALISILFYFQGL